MQSLFGSLLEYVKSRLFGRSDACTADEANGRMHHVCVLAFLSVVVERMLNI